MRNEAPARNGAPVSAKNRPASRDGPLVKSSPRFFPGKTPLTNMTRDQRSGIGTRKALASSFFWQKRRIENARGSVRRRACGAGGRAAGGQACSAGNRREGGHAARESMRGGRRGAGGRRDALRFARRRTRPSLRERPPAQGPAAPSACPAAPPRGRASVSHVGTCPARASPAQAPALASPSELPSLRKGRCPPSARPPRRREGATDDVQTARVRTAPRARANVSGNPRAVLVLGGAPRAYERLRWNVSRETFHAMPARVHASVSMPLSRAISTHSGAPPRARERPHRRCH